MKTITIERDNKIAEFTLNGLMLTLVGYVDSETKQLVLPTNDETAAVWDYTQPIDITNGVEMPLFTVRVMTATDNSEGQLDFCAAVEAGEFETAAALLNYNTGTNLIAIH